ncbi:type III-B CRISPR module RAMP protein Cmr6 [Palaeococcus sp. (in: euryarchaeotes)]
MKIGRDFDIQFFLPEYLEGYAKEVIHIRDYGNFSLIFSKYVPFISEDKKREQGKPKVQGFGFNIKPKLLPYYANFFNLYREMWKSIDNSIEFSLKTKTRLVVGLGDEGVYETSIRLHRNYGVPYIPGSTIKGVTKHHLIFLLTSAVFSDGDFFKLAGKVQEALENGNLDWFGKQRTSKGNHNEEEIKKLRDIFGTDNPKEIAEKGIEIFGTTEKEGEIIFFDALPVPDSLRDKMLEVDIMNPHYPNYYQGNEPPGDWQTPNPIFFLTVPAGVKFQFCIAPRRKERVKLLGRTKKLLISALQEHGVGAKTAIGYGRLE